MIEAATGTATGDGYDLHKKKRRKEKKEKQTCVSSLDGVFI